MEDEPDSSHSFSVHVHHKAQDYSSFSIALEWVQALDAGSGLADKDQSHLIDISWRLTYWSIFSFHADIDCMFDNQCGSGAAFFFQVTLNGLPSMYYSAMFQNLKTSAPSLRSMTHSLYLVLSEAHTQRAGKSGPQVWPNEPCDLNRLG